MKSITKSKCAATTMEINIGLTPTGDIFSEISDPELINDAKATKATEIKINRIFNCQILFGSNLTLLIKLKLIQP